MGMLHEIAIFDEISKSYYKAGMTPLQCRAARALLGWSQAALATKAKVSTSTILDFEAKRRMPHPNNLTAIQAVLETAKIRFIGTTGVDFIESMPPDKPRSGRRKKGR
jgi:transcriptional regulator with XRE-family HTH domain